MLQITADISSLSRVQREAIASFVLNFPQSTPEDIDTDVLDMQPFSLPQSPEEAFGPTPVTGDNDRLDKTGIPWDERIHASTRVKTADGNWRKKRGIDESVVAHVEGELKALMAIPAAPSLQALEMAKEGTVLPAVPAPPVPEPVAIVPPAPVVDPKVAFVALITLASDAITANKLTQEQLTAAVVASGVPSLPLLSSRLDLVPQVAATIRALIASAA